MIKLACRAMLGALIATSSYASKCDSFKRSFQTTLKQDVIVPVKKDIASFVKKSNPSTVKTVSYVAAATGFVLHAVGVCHNATVEHGVSEPSFGVARNIALSIAAMAQALLLTKK